MRQALAVAPSADRKPESDAGPTLLIFDLHQDLPWVREILRRESGRWRHLVLGGDYFDTYLEPPEVADARAMARFLRELVEDLGDRLTLLWGNHDIAYVEAWRRGGAVDPWQLRHGCPGYDPETARVLQEEWPDSLWERGRLCCFHRGRLISHAGVHPHFWYYDRNPLEALDALEAHCQIALTHLHRQTFPILLAGGCRGGREPVGGITWLDFHHEYRDDLPVRQIFGHTPSEEGARRRGNATCLDGCQATYGLLHPNGRLVVRQAEI